MRDLEAAYEAAVDQIPDHIRFEMSGSEERVMAANMVDAALASLADGGSVWVVDQERCDTYCDDDKGGDHIVGDCMVEVWPNE